LCRFRFVRVYGLIRLPVTKCIQIVLCLLFEWPTIVQKKDITTA
jgi:hypothetical protein